VYKRFGPLSMQTEGQCLFTVGRLGVLEVEFHNSPHRCPEHLDFPFASVMLGTAREDLEVQGIVYQAFEVVTNAVFVAYPLMATRYCEFVELVFTVNVYFMLSYILF